MAGKIDLMGHGFCGIGERIKSMVVHFSFSPFDHLTLAPDLSRKALKKSKNGGFKLSSFNHVFRAKPIDV